MKKAFLKVASTATAFTLLCTQMSPILNVFAEDAPETSGKCGIDLYWDYTDGTLTISGSSEKFYSMYNHPTKFPWYPLQNEITNLVFDENCGVEEIPSYAFLDYENLETITLSPHVKYIAGSAIRNTNITEVTIPESMVYIATKNFGVYSEENGKERSDCTVYGLANSAASNFCLDTGCTFVATQGELQEVNLTADTWSFANAPDDFKNSMEQFVTYLNDEHKTALLENMTNIDYALSGNMTKDIWAGSCLGMSSLLTLCRNGVLSPSDIQAGAETVNDIHMDDETESLIDYYAVVLNGYVVENLFCEARLLSDEERTQNLLAYGQKAHDEGKSFIALLSGGKGGGHAVVGADMISGQWNLGGMTYDTCIQILDPNYENRISMGSSFYYNTETGAWVQPNKVIGNTANLYEGLCAFTDSVDLLNYCGLLKGNMEYNSDTPKKANLAGAGYEMNGTTLEVIDSNGEVITTWDEGWGDVSVRNLSITYPTEDTITVHRIINEEADYKNLAIMCTLGYDYYLFTQGNDAEYMTFSPDTLSFEFSEWGTTHSKKPFYATLTFNKERFQEDFIWDTIMLEVDAKNVQDGSITQAANGYILSGDMLKNAAVSFRQIKTEKMKRVNLAVDEPSVFLTTQEDGGIAIMADKDNDGIYETMLNEGAYPIPFDITFASDILQYYAWAAAGIDVSGIDTEYWDVNNDGSIDIEDSAYVLQKYAEAAAGLN